LSAGNSRSVVDHDGRTYLRAAYVEREDRLF
jgi:hypothetical protein